MQRAVSDYEIFDTWRPGPAATIRLFERVFGTVALYGPPPPDHLQPQHRLPLAAGRSPT